MGGARSARDIPRLAAAGLAITWRAGRRELTVIALLELLPGIGVAAEVVVGRRLLESVLTAQQTTASIAAVWPSAAVLGVITAALGRHERHEDTASIVRAAERSGADADIGTLPEGYETLLGPAFINGTDLSQGQWQRLALARTFFRDAPLVILDEPTASLDAKAEHKLFARIRELLAGRSVLLISHRFSTVRSAGRIYVLSGGRVAESGTNEELVAAGGLYAELFSLQALPYQ